MAKQSTTQMPKSGDTYRCENCGMEMTLQSDCQSGQGGPRFECCGQPLCKV